MLPKTTKCEKFVHIWPWKGHTRNNTKTNRCNEASYQWSLQCNAFSLKVDWKYTLVTKSRYIFSGMVNRSRIVFVTSKFKLWEWFIVTVELVISFYRTTQVIQLHHCKLKRIFLCRINYMATICSKKFQQKSYKPKAQKVADIFFEECTICLVKWQRKREQKSLDLKGIIS